MENQTMVSPVIKHREPIEELLTFPQALNLVIDEKKITKKEWDNKNIYVLLKDNFLMIHKDDGKFYQLIINDGDLLGIDWMEVE